MLGWGGGAGKGGGSCSQVQMEYRLTEEFITLPGALLAVLLLELKHALWITHSQKKG